MSFSKNISNHIVRFKDEIDYLNCRIDYLGYCKNCEDSYHGVCAPDMLSFFGFIQNEMYDKNKCEIENTDTMSISSMTFMSTPQGPSPFYDAFNNFGTSIQGNFNIPSGAQREGFTANVPTQFGAFTTPDSIIGISTEISSKENKVEPIKSRFDILDL